MVLCPPPRRFGLYYRRFETISDESFRIFLRRAYVKNRVAGFLR